MLSRRLAAREIASLPSPRGRRAGDEGERSLKMVKVIRYTLAIACFAASVACLAFWWRSMSAQDVLIGPSYVQPTYGVLLETIDGVGLATVIFERSPNLNRPPFKLDWQYSSRPVMAMKVRRSQMAPLFERHGIFWLSIEDGMAYLPLWYPAFLFALAGVAVLRFRRQFSICSALITTTVVAALIAMAVIL